MTNTYCETYLHVVFAVKHRQALIDQSWEERLYKYISGITSQCGQKLLAINGMPDHIHILLSFGPDCKLSDLMRSIKSSSSKWVNENRLAQGKFQWQTGYGAFSVSTLSIDVVRNYIRGQKQHHSKKTFREEFIQALEDNDIEFDQRYIFHAPE